MDKEPELTKEQITAIATVAAARYMREMTSNPGFPPEGFSKEERVHHAEAWIDAEQRRIASTARDIQAALEDFETLKEYERIFSKPRSGGNGSRGR